MPKQISDTSQQVRTPNPSTPEATRTAPFDLPLQRGDYGDDICDDHGAFVANLYGDERDPKTVAQRDYVLRAVNSYDDMLAALKKIAANYGGCHCDHTDENCCEKAGEFCPHCIAEIAIAKAERCPMNAVLATSHASSVPEREFERPTTINELRNLAYLGSETVHNAMHHVGFKKEQDDAWQILRCAQLETTSAHGFICYAMFIGLPDWQKAGAA